MKAGLVDKDKENCLQNCFELHAVDGTNRCAIAYNNTYGIMGSPNR